MNPPSYQQQSRDLIDGLKAVCASNGLGNDGNEYKIIVQTFLYKLLSGIGPAYLGSSFRRRPGSSAFNASKPWRWIPGRRFAASPALPYLIHRV